jgi:hypothetical protein
MRKADLHSESEREFDAYLSLIEHSASLGRAFEYVDDREKIAHIKVAVAEISSFTLAIESVLKSQGEHVDLEVDVIAFENIREAANKILDI